MKIQPALKTSLAFTATTLCGGVLIAFDKIPAAGLIVIILCLLVCIAIMASALRKEVLNFKNG
ncbi:MAG: hypothetical protein V4686_01905 [Patescibacteria group bacterium]